MSPAVPADARSLEERCQVQLQVRLFFLFRGWDGGFSARFDSFELLAVWFERIFCALGWLRSHFHWGIASCLVCLSGFELLFVSGGGGVDICALVSPRTAIISLD